MLPEQVAAWMLVELEREEFLYQQQVVWDIAEKFGEEFTYINNNGNMAIRGDVLAEFRRLSSDRVVWERGERMWRKRSSFDEPGRQQS